MKKLILSMVFATMFVACADNNVCVAPEYTQPIQDSTYTQPGQDTTYNPIYDTTYNPIQDTTDTNSTPVYYDMVIGSMCVAMNVQSLETITGQCQSDLDTIAMNWSVKCYYTNTATEYINYTIDQIVAILTNNLLFDYNLVNSLITQVSNCGAIAYSYNTNNGLKFMYIERVGDNKGFN